MDEGNKEEKKKEAKKDFRDAISAIASTKQAELFAKRGAEMRQRILQSFKNRPDGSDLADGFVTVIRYFNAIGYWRGYKNAKRHYADMNSVRRTPDGRQRVHAAVERMLSADVKKPTTEICEELDRLRLSASFDLPANQKRNQKERIIHVGPMRSSGTIKYKWVQASKDTFVKAMISRIRTRLRDERRAKAWMELSDKVWRDSPHEESTQGKDQPGA